MIPEASSENYYGILESNLSEISKQLTNNHCYQSDFNILEKLKKDARVHLDRVKTRNTLNVSPRNSFFAIPGNQINVSEMPRPEMKKL